MVLPDAGFRERCDRVTSMKWEYLASATTKHGCFFPSELFRSSCVVKVFFAALPSFFRLT